MFFDQFDIVNRHAAVNSLAHVINRQQTNLDGGECFHFDASRADSFHSCHADDVRRSGRRARNCFKINRHTGQRQRMAKRDQVAGFLAA